MAPVMGFYYEEGKRSREKMDCSSRCAGRTEFIIVFQGSARKLSDKKINSILLDPYKCCKCLDFAVCRECSLHHGVASVCAILCVCVRWGKARGSTGVEERVINHVWVTHNEI